MLSSFAISASVVGCRVDDRLVWPFKFGIIFKRFKLNVMQDDNVDVSTNWNIFN
jgi:hypothetical protein